MAPAAAAPAPRRVTGRVAERGRVAGHRRRLVMPVALAAALAAVGAAGCGDSRPPDWALAKATTTTTGEATAARGTAGPPATGPQAGRAPAEGTAAPARPATTAPPPSTVLPPRPPPGLPAEPAVPDLPEGPVPLAVADGVRPFTGLDGPDPFVAVDRGVAWAFTTNIGPRNVPATNGAALVDALPELPAWAVAGRTWAPAIVRTETRWTLAFTAHHRASGRQCIGVATASRVQGPYTARPDPLVCDVAEGGSIDPSFVRDTAGLRLLYKVDGNCCGRPTPLRSVPLAPDGTAVAGPAATLVTADLPWERGLIEAPTMGVVDDRWLLLYSAGAWQTDAYAVGAAWCDTPAGPCRKTGAPILASGGELRGPGGLEVIAAAVGLDGSRLVVFHAWRSGTGGPAVRQLHLGRLAVAGDTVTVVPVVAASL
jgi:arabinan endo-1,5-alpha-L-arabinosidase